METNSQQPTAEQSAQQSFAQQQPYAQQQAYNQQPYGNQAYTAPAPIVVTDEGKLYLKSAGSWGMFLAVLGIIGIIFLSLAGIVTIVGASKVGALTSYDYYGNSVVHSIGSSMKTTMYIVGIIYIVLALVYSYPVKCLLTFNSKVKTAIISNNTADMTIAFKNIKGFFKFFGMLVIISFALGILVILVVIIAMAAI